MSTNRKNLEKIMIDALGKVETSAEYVELLNFCAKFRNYSYRNQLLIYSQYPTAVEVNSFQRWKKLERKVNKGEKAIYILAPVCLKLMLDADGNKVENEDEAVKVLENLSFKRVPVFDVAQTSGKPLNHQDGMNGLTSVNGDATELLNRLIDVAVFVYRVPVLFVASESDRELRGGAHGYYTPELNQITIAEDIETADKIHVLCHELGHMLLGHRGKGTGVSKREQELQAETFAFFVCDRLGVDNRARAALYAFDWSGGSSELVLSVFDVVEGAVKLFFEDWEIKRSLLAA